MKLLLRPIIPFAAILIIGATCSVQLAIANKNKKDSAAVQMDEQKRALHALNRLGNRRRPIFPFLGRKNALNRYAGRLRHLTLRLLHVA